MISSTVVRSLNTGMTTESRGSAGTGEVGRGMFHTKPKPYHILSAGVRREPPASRARAELARRCGDGAARDRRRAPRLARVRRSMSPRAPRSRRSSAGAGHRSRCRARRPAIACRDGDRLAGTTRRCCCRTPSTVRRSRWSAGMPERWGYAHDCRGALLTRCGCAAVARAPGRVLPASDHGARLCAADRSSPVSMCRRRRAERGLALLARAGWDGRTPLVALAPGAAYGGAKRWPARSFAASSRGSPVTVSPRCSSAPRRIWLPARSCARSSAAGSRSIDLIGRTDLPRWRASSRTVRALVTNDSGAMHLAAALGRDGHRDVRTDQRAGNASARRGPHVRAAPSESGAAPACCASVR